MGALVVFAVFKFVWVERIVISSAHVISFILLLGGVRKSDGYILNSVGESTSPCGTPVFVFACFGFVLLYNVNCFVTVASPCICVLSDVDPAAFYVCLVCRHCFVAAA